MRYDGSTFLGTKQKQLKQMLLDIEYFPGDITPLPILVDNDFNLQFHVTDFTSVISNIKAKGHQLAADVDQDSNLITVDGLIGIDHM